MAKEKKKEEISLEEKLEKALVPATEQPYEVPENWCWTKNCIICQLGDGVKCEGDILPYLEVKYLRGVKEAEMLSKGKLIEAGTKVILVDGENSGEVFDIHEKGYIGSTFKTLVMSQGVYDKYLLYFIHSNKDLLRNNKTGSAIPHLNKKLFFDLAFPLPPLAEQQRIVEQIESLFSKLDEAREKIDYYLNEESSRRKSLINKAFTGELSQKWRLKNNRDVANYLENIDFELGKVKKKKMKKVTNELSEFMRGQVPQEWLCVDLERISSIITDGEHQTPKRTDEYCGYYLLSARNVYDDSLRLDNVDYVDEAEYTRISNRCNPKKGDVLISCSGSVGRSCVIEDDNKYCMVRSAAMLSTVGVNPRFVMYMLQSDYAQEQIKKLVKQTAQANLFLGAIAAITIPLPHIDEQDEIVHILDGLLDSVYKAMNGVEVVVDQIDLMKKSILVKAFRGRLGTNKSHEDSSLGVIKSILLEKNNEEPIKMQRKYKPEVLGVERSILEVLNSMGKLTPEKLKKETKLDIDTFYEKLKELIDTNKIAEMRVMGEVYLEAKHEDR